ncbi:MAG: cell division protein FtsA [bacterium]|nr:cell division protein FtsA [bacterium]
MSQGRLFVACDFGSTSFRALVCETTDNGEMEVVGCAHEKVEGFQDGDFIDLGAGARCIARCIRDLEADSDIYVSGFTYNIGGSHLHSIRATAQISIGPGPRPIRQGDVDAVIKKARGMAIPFDQKILTVTPVEFSVDRVRGIVDPLGRVGSLLEIQAHLVMGSRSVLNNIENAVETAKYKPLGEEVDVMAAGMALLEPQEKTQGAMLIDIGGDLTNWAVYRKGTILANGSIPWGGNHMTADLAHGLRVDWDQAESIKRQRGVVMRNLAPEVSLSTLFNEEKPEETKGLIAAILEPRMEEILTMVKKDFGDLRELSSLGAGIILTGGGSHCRGTKGLCEEIFDLQVRKRYLPRKLAGSDHLPEGQWATVIGLCRCSAKDSEMSDPQEDSRPGGGLLGKLRGMFKKQEPQRSGTHYPEPDPEEDDGEMVAEG